MGDHCTNINENAANVSIHKYINILYTCLMQCKLQLYTIMLFQIALQLYLNFLNDWTCEIVLFCLQYICKHKAVSEEVEHMWEVRKP